MNDSYDVVIVGSGIGGLICGCYLAKSGLKVLIVEQHYKAGGYCTSFDRNGYRFDVGVHYLGSLRDGGALNRIFNELSLFDKITIIRSDVCDRIVVPDMTVLIRNNSGKTKEELISNFPKEKNNINSFFQFLYKNDFLDIVSKTKNITFKELIDNFFSDYKLKAILSIPLGNLGLSPSIASALASVVLYKEYIFDPGYFPKGGVQILPDILVSRFKQYGGDILFSTRVQKIITKNKKLIGVQLHNQEVINTRNVVSNVDATSTFNELLDCKTKEASTIKKLKPSPSAFVMYLGINTKLGRLLPKHYATWFFSTYDIEKCYDYQISSNVKNIDYLLCAFSSLVDQGLAPKGKSTLKLFVGIKNYMIDRKVIFEEKLQQLMLRKLNDFLPNILDLIEIKEIATPFTFYKFTSNHNGSLFGWASTKDQIDRKIFSHNTSIEGLYLAGHWAISGVGQGGITQVSISGRHTAKAILNKIQDRRK